MRRAVAVAPLHERVLEIWTYVKDKFPDSRNLLYYPMTKIEMMSTLVGGKKRELHGFIISENINWAGWCYCSEDDNPDLNPIKRNRKNVNGIGKDSRMANTKNNKMSSWAQLSQGVRKDYSIWYNPADGTQQSEMPNFEVELDVRKRRSHYTESLGGLESYFDPLTYVHFQYHALTNTYT